MSNLNCEFQYYKGLPLQLIERYDYNGKKAKRFTINGTNQNVWIPNKHLLPNGTIKPNENLDYIFAGATRQLELAGIMMGFLPLNKEIRLSERQLESRRYVKPKKILSWEELNSAEINCGSEHPEINNMDDYYTHYAHEPF